MPRLVKCFAILKYVPDVYQKRGSEVAAACGDIIVQKQLGLHKEFSLCIFGTELHGYRKWLKSQLIIKRYILHAA